MAAPLDPRTHAYRPDLADARLKDLIAAERYVDAGAGQAALPVVPVAERPDPEAPLVTELLYGETVRVLDERHGWVWLQSDVDDYVGYAPTSALSPDVRTTTHRVSALATFAFSRPDIKSPPLMDLPLGARVTVDRTEGQFAVLIDGGHVPARHVAPEGTHAPDFVAIAELFHGTPYLWGGRSRIGCDCSGLVQVALQAAGIACPRDSDMQQAGLGSSIDVASDLSGLRRGDLVFWRGHVGMMLDAERLLHANAHHMAVAIEPLREAAGRIVLATGNTIVAVRRLPGLTAV